LSDVVAILDRHAREGEHADPEAIALDLQQRHGWSRAAAERAGFVWHVLYRLREDERQQRRRAGRRRRAQRRCR
jgi:hypothetical protein